MSNDEERRVVTVTAKWLLISVDWGLVTETRVVDVPDGVTDDDVRAYVLEQDSDSPWFELENEEFIYMDAQVQKVLEAEVHMPIGDPVPEFFLDWDAEKETFGARSK